MYSRQQMQSKLPYILLLIAIISIQLGATLAKGLFDVLGAIESASFRLIFATIILFAIFKPWKLVINRQELISLTIYGVSLGCMNLFFYMALERIPQGVAVALEFTGPLAVACFLSKKATDFIWPVVALVGIILLIPFESVDESLDMTGIIYALIAGASWGLYIIYGAKSSSSLSGGKATAMGMMFASFFVVPFGATHGDLGQLSIEILPVLIAVAILSSALPYTLEMYSLKKIPPRNFGILLSFEPAIATIFGLAFLQENLLGQYYLGIGLIILASLGSSLFKKNVVSEI